MEEVSRILDKLETEGSLRVLRDVVRQGKYVIYDGVRYLDMSSNDYLGIAGDAVLQKAFFESLCDEGRFLMGSTGSRLMTGNSMDYTGLESELSLIYNGKSALVFGSGYAANTGILPALTSKNDLILADKLVHASLIDGMRLCDCEWQRFAHNDMGHLETLIQKAVSKGYDNIWVVTESVFSMDGDRAPVAELVQLKHRYGFNIYLDEAHAFGVDGPLGAGYAAALGLENDIDVVVGTFGKAIASCGAFAIIDPEVRELLINRMRPLIFSTALPPINLMWTKFILERMDEFGERRSRLKDLIRRIAPDNPASTHILPVMAYGNRESLALAERLKEHGFWTTAIRYPTVPKGQERIRVSLSAAMDEADIDRFREVCRHIG